MKKVVSSFLLFPLALLSQEVTSISLNDAINKALEKSIELKEINFSLQDALSEELKLKGELRPKLELMYGVGPHYAISGDVTDFQKDKSQIGVMNLSKVELTVPLFGFGRGDDYLTAIKGLQAKAMSDVELKKLDIAYKIKELYFGNILANNLLEFANSSISDLEQAIEKLDKKKNIDDISRLNILLQQVYAKKAELEKLATISSMGLNLYLTLKADPSFKPLDEWIDRPEYPENQLEYYLELAQKNRPEFKQVQTGISSKTAQLAGDKKGYLPTFALLAKYDFASAPLVTDQTNPFVYDSYNKSELAVGVGLVWKFDLGITQGKINKTQAELNGYLTKKEYANLAIEMEVRAAYFDYQEKLQKVGLSSKAYKEAQKWLRRVSSSLALGLISAKDLVDSYQANAGTMGQYYQALYDAHLSYAKLMQKTGNIQ